VVGFEANLLERIEAGKSAWAHPHARAAKQGSHSPASLNQMLEEFGF